VPEQGLVHNMDEVIEKLLSDAQIHKTSFTPRTAMEAVIIGLSISLKFSIHKGTELHQYSFGCEIIADQKNCGLPHQHESRRGYQVCLQIPFLNPYIKIFSINCSGWRSGGSAHLSVLSREALTPADRELLSNQDKGLQTFIRNQHQVFSVESAIVSIRKWPLVNAQFTAKAGGRVRNANCWFLKWHPDGQVSL
jgi:hypothetical protein